MSESIVLNVSGMKCGGCENNVKTKLSAVVGVSAVAADHKAKQVSIDFDPAQTSAPALVQVITQAGYQVAE